MCSAPPGSSLGRVNSSRLCLPPLPGFLLISNSRIPVSSTSVQDNQQDKQLLLMSRSSKPHDLHLLARKPAGHVCPGRKKNEDALWEGLLTWQRRKCNSVLKIMVTQGKALLLCQWASEGCQETDSYRGKECQHIIEIDPMGTNTATKCKMFAETQAMTHRLTTSCARPTQHCQAGLTDWLCADSHSREVTGEGHCPS